MIFYLFHSFRKFFHNFEKPYHIWWLNIWNLIQTFVFLPASLFISATSYYIVSAWWCELYVMSFSIVHEIRFVLKNLITETTLIFLKRLWCWSVALFWVPKPAYTIRKVTFSKQKEFACPYCSWMYILPVAQQLNLVVWVLMYWTVQVHCIDTECNLAQVTFQSFCVWIFICFI